MTQAGSGRKVALLHIGTPKTGTTSIQESLASAEAHGSLLPYRYPLGRGRPNHNRLAWLYIPNQELPTEIAWQSQEGLREEYRRFIFGELSSSRGAIISGEDLSQRFGPCRASQLRRDLESLGFRDFHVLLYVRDPASFYLSYTQHLLKWSSGGLVCDPTSFRYPFRPIAETWDQAFPGSLVIRHYSGGADDDIVEDFSDQLQKCLGIALRRSEVRLNTTVSAEAMVVMQDYRLAFGPDEDGQIIPGLDRLVSFLMRSTEHIPQTRPALKAEVAETVRANHRDDAEFIFSRYGVDLGLQGFVAAAPLAARSSWRVEDIVESFDPDIVERLREEFARADSDRRKSMPLHVAKRFYRSVPLSRRPARLDGWLRSRFGGGPSA
jgi:hypothetical protein